MTKYKTAPKFDPTSLDLEKMVQGISSANVGVELIKGQETPEVAAWRQMRIGKITGSMFDKIKRGRSGKGWSETAESYLCSLIWEHITRLQSSDFTGSKSTEWGTQYEPEALQLYQKHTRSIVMTGEFYALKGANLIGCTPDGVGHKGLEIKCPYAAKAHIRTLLSREVPSEYIDQVNGHILITNKEGCDFVSYDPRFMDTRPDLALCIIEVERNNIAIEELENRLYDFETELIKRLDRLEINWR